MIVWPPVVRRAGPRAFRHCPIRGRSVPVARLTVEAHLGRLLTAEEIVHHINGDRADDRLSNLQVTDKRAHHGIHVAMERMYAAWGTEELSFNPRQYVQKQARLHARQFGSSS